MPDQFYFTKKALSGKEEPPNPRSSRPVAEVIHMFNSGDRGAFDQVYRELYPNVFYFACRFVDQEDAADITADAFLKLWNQKKDFASLQKIRIFLQVCVRNACINFLAKQRFRKQREEEIAHFQKELQVIEFEGTTAKAEILKRIYEQIELLPAGAREIFRLSILEGLDSRQIAARLGVTDSTVRNQKKRAISILKMAIGKMKILILATFLISVGVANC